MIGLSDIFSIHKIISGWRRKPVPVILFEYDKKENDYCQSKTIENFANRKGWFYRAGVINKGKNKDVIKNADLRVESMYILDAPEKGNCIGSPFFLHWANEKTDNSRNLYSDTEVFVDLVHTAQGVDKFLIFHKDKHGGSGINNVFGIGKYKMKIKLVAENLDPIEKEFIIEFNGDWENLKISMV